MIKLMNENKYKKVFACLLSGTVLIWLWVLLEIGMMVFNWERFKGSVAEMIVPEVAESKDEYSMGVVVAQSEVINEVSQKFEVVADDARPIVIRKYLEKYKSPLLPYADLILSLSETYGFDYRWMVAIGQQESNLCKKIPENSFNCWGYGINSAGTLRFADYETALRSYAEYLDREYFKKGLNTPELIMKKYCPHSNGSWAYGVNQFMEEMENGSFL